MNVFLFFSIYFNFFRWNMFVFYFVKNCFFFQEILPLSSVRICQIPYNPNILKLQTKCIDSIFREFHLILSIRLKNTAKVYAAYCKRWLKLDSCLHCNACTTRTFKRENEFTRCNFPFFLSYYSCSFLSENAHTRNGNSNTWVGSGMLPTIFTTITEFRSQYTNWSCKLNESPFKLLNLSILYC